MAESADKFIECLITGSYVDNKEFSDYLQVIGSYNVDQLLKEPNRLQNEKDQLQKQTQELAFSNYNTFIQTADCSRQIFKQFNETQSKIDSLLTQLPVLRTESQNLVKISEETNVRKQRNNHLLSHTSQVLDVLELPQLMDSCIRREQFDEALELFSYIRRLGQKHDNIPLITSVVKALEGSWRGMVHQLLNQLRSDLPLPKCLQIIGFLRRMDVFTDSELRLKFLQARETWLRSLISSLTVAKGENLSLKKLEILRINLFNIITQQRALFSDEDLVLPSDDCVNVPCIFYSWMIEQISQILSVVEEGCLVKQGDCLETILAQTMYFGLSFSRVGADFRGLVALRLQRAALLAAENGLKKANLKFEQDMEHFVLAPGSATFTPPQSTSDGPPLLLLEFPPLAHLANGILRVFNEMRNCAPLSIAHAVTLALRETLLASTKVIVAFHRQEQSALGVGESATLVRFCLAYQALLSYLSKCITTLFPLSELAAHLSLPVHQIQTLEIVCLKEDAIMQPLLHLIPKKEPFPLQ